MHRYEVLVLTAPEITADEASSLETQFGAVLKELDCTLVSFERWGKYKLAYPVRKHEYGVYFLTRFETEDVAILAKINPALRAFFGVKHDTLVMRHMIVSLAPRATLQYQRPESLEEAPAREEKETQGARPYGRGGDRGDRNRGDRGNREDRGGDRGGYNREPRSYESASHTSQAQQGL